MSEVSLYTFPYKEVVEALLKKQGITEGIWALYVEFGIGAANAGQNEESIMPCAIVPVVKLGIQRAEKENVLSVDASKMNLKGTTKAKRSAKPTLPDLKKPAHE